MDFKSNIWKLCGPTQVIMFWLILQQIGKFFLLQQTGSKKNNFIMHAFFKGP